MDMIEGQYFEKLVGLKEGDEVECVHSASPSTFTVGKKYIVKIEDKKGHPYILSNGGIGVFTSWSKFIIVKSARIYPNGKHPHYNLIIEWAKGAEIQFLSRLVTEDGRPKWKDTANPVWNEKTQYRIKPHKTEKDIEIEKLESEMRSMADRIAKLREEVK